MAKLLSEMNKVDIALTPASMQRLPESFFFHWSLWQSAIRAVGAMARWNFYCPDPAGYLMRRGLEQRLLLIALRR